MLGARRDLVRRLAARAALHLLRHNRAKRVIHNAAVAALGAAAARRRERGLGGGHLVKRRIVEAGR